MASEWADTRPSGMRAVGGLGILALGIGCSDDLRVAWPDRVDARTAIVAVTHGSLGLEVFGGDPPVLPARIEALEPEDRLFVLYYRGTPQALGLLEGPLPLADPALPNRALPDLELGFVLDPDGAEAETWRALEALEEPLLGARINLATIDCLLRGGCASANGCKLPCTPPRPDPPEAPQPPSPVAAPMPPTPVSLLPCPTGWSEEADLSPLGVTRCNPRPTAADCSGAEVQWLGAASCATIGPACPSGRFADDLPSAGVIYVDAAAPLGGDGSQLAPLRSVAEGLALAAPGTMVALAKGEWTENIEIQSGVTIRGACVEATILRGVQGAIGAVYSAGDGVVIERMTINGPAHGLVFASAEATASNLRIEVGDIGVMIVGGQFIGRDLVVRRGRLGIRAEDAVVGLDNGVFEDAAEGALVVLGGTATIADLRIFGPTDRPTPFPGSIVVGDRGNLTGDRVLVESSYRGLAIVEGAGATFRDVVTRDTLDEAAFVDEGATLTLNRAQLTGARGAGLLFNQDTSGSAVDLVIERILDRDPFEIERSIGVGPRAHFELHRGAIDHDGHQAIEVTGLSTLVAEDLRLRALGAPNEGIGFESILASRSLLVLHRVDLEGPGSEGITLRNTSTATLTDVAIREASTVGIGANDSALWLDRCSIGGGPSGGVRIADGTLQAQDVFIHDLTSGGRNEPAFAALSSTITLERIAVERVEKSAVHLDAGASTVSDLFLRDTGVASPGFVVSSGITALSARLALDRASLVRVASVGIQLTSGRAELRDVDIEQVSERARIGAGIRIQRGTDVDVERARIIGVEGSGVVVDTPGTVLDMRDLEVDADTVGAVLVDRIPVTILRAKITTRNERAFKIEDPGTVIDLSDIHLIGPGACSEHPATGLHVSDFAETHLTRFLIEDESTFGVSLGFMSTLTMTDGEVQGSCIGVELLSADEPTLAAFSGVRLLANPTPLRIAGR